MIKTSPQYMDTQSNTPLKTIEFSITGLKNKTKNQKRNGEKKKPPKTTGLK